MAKLLSIILLLAICALSTASPPPSLPDKCDNLITGLSSCLPYAIKGSNVTVPDKDCCKGMASIVKNTPDCICPIFDSLAGFNVNMTRAFGLPKTCSVELPHDCKGASPSPPHTPTPAPPKPSPPSPSPSPAPTPTPSPAPTPSPSPAPTPAAPAPAPTPRKSTPPRTKPPPKKLSSPPKKSPSPVPAPAPAPPVPAPIALTPTPVALSPEIEAASSSTGISVSLMTVLFGLAVAALI